MAQSPDDGWYYMAFGSSNGPITATELVDSVKNGNLTPLTMVRHESQQEWQSVNEAFPGRVPSLEEYAKEETERSGCVWVISIFFFLSGILSLYLLQRMMTARFGSPFFRLVEQLGFVGLILFLLSALLAVLGAVALFWMKRAAFYVFVAMLGLLLVQDAFILFAAGSARYSSGPVETASFVISSAILLSVCAYCWALVKAGRLK